MRELTYQEVCVLAGAERGYAAAREIGLGNVTEDIDGWGAQQYDDGSGLIRDVVDDAVSCVQVYSNGDVQYVPQPTHGPDFDMGPVEVLAEHVMTEGLYEGHRTGVCAVAARAVELAGEIAEFGEHADESPAHQAKLAELAAHLSTRYGIPADAPPRFHHPAGVS
jgi:hypothetical protein